MLGAPAHAVGGLLLPPSHVGQNKRAADLHAEWPHDPRDCSYWHPSLRSVSKILDVYEKIADYGFYALDYLIINRLAKSCHPKLQDCRPPTSSSNRPSEQRGRPKGTNANRGDRTTGVVQLSPANATGGESSRTGGQLSEDAASFLSPTAVLGSRGPQVLRGDNRGSRDRPAGGRMKRRAPPAAAGEGEATTGPNPNEAKSPRRNKLKRKNSATGHDIRDPPPTDFSSEDDEETDDNVGGDEVDAEFGPARAHAADDRNRPNTSDVVVDEGRRGRSRVSSGSSCSRKELGPSRGRSEQQRVLKRRKDPHQYRGKEVSRSTRRASIDFNTEDGADSCLNPLSVSPTTAAAAKATPAGQTAHTSDREHSAGAVFAKILKPRAGGRGRGAGARRSVESSVPTDEDGDVHVRAVGAAEQGPSSLTMQEVEEPEDEAHPILRATEELLLKRKHSNSYTSTEGALAGGEEEARRTEAREVEASDAKEINSTAPTSTARTANLGHHRSSFALPAVYLKEKYDRCVASFDNGLCDFLLPLPHRPLKDRAPVVVCTSLLATIEAALLVGMLGLVPFSPTATAAVSSSAFAAIPLTTVTASVSSLLAFLSTLSPSYWLFQTTYALAVWSYFRAVVTPPGFIPKSGWSLRPQPSLTFERKRKGCDQFRYCTIEGTYKPDRAHFCRTQGRNVLRMDHYCGFMNNTIGYDNHKHFLLFLLYSSGLSTATMQSLWTANVHLVFTTAASTSTAVVSHAGMAFYAAMLGVSTLVSAAAVPFCCFTLYLAVKNQTTIEFVEGRRVVTKKLVVIPVPKSKVADIAYHRAQLLELVSSCEKTVEEDMMPAEAENHGKSVKVIQTLTARGLRGQISSDTGSSPGSTPVRPRSLIRLSLSPDEKLLDDLEEFAKSEQDVRLLHEERLAAAARNGPDPRSALLSGIKQGGAGGQESTSTIGSSLAAALGLVTSTSEEMLEFVNLRNYDEPLVQVVAVDVRNCGKEKENHAGNNADPKSCDAPSAALVPGPLSPRGDVDGSGERQEPTSATLDGGKQTFYCSAPYRRDTIVENLEVIFGDGSATRLEWLLPVPPRRKSNAAAPGTHFPLRASVVLDGLQDAALEEEEMEYLQDENRSAFEEEDESVEVDDEDEWSAGFYSEDEKSSDMSSDVSDFSPADIIARHRLATR